MTQLAHEQIHRSNAVRMIKNKVFQPCDGGPLLRAMYLATLVWPTSIPILSSSPWIRGAPHNGFAMFISRINWRSSSDTAGRPGRRLDFQRPLNSLLTVGRESEGANLRAPR